jgi:hypothetical protein
MQLFRKSPPPPQTEPAPAPVPEPVSALVAAEAELEAASQACTESSRHCAELDRMQREWMAQREAAFRKHTANLERHADAKERWLRLSNPAPVKTSAPPFPVGAVIGGN